VSAGARAHVDALVPGKAGSAIDSLDFTLPDALVAREPAEARGLARDEVRLLVSDPEHDGVRHATARDLPQFLRSGDVLVVNTSATINAAVDAWRPAHGTAPDEMIALHLSSPVPFAASDTRWIVELRRLTPHGSQPLLDAVAGEEIRLRGGGSATLVTPFGIARATAVPGSGVRLWEAVLACSGGVLAYAAEHGSPIRYGYVRDRWPLSAYQTMFSREPGSAEMPSAGRPFTRKMVAALEAKGVIVAPLVLHTGVASLEAGEAPYPERYRVPETTAEIITQARRGGGRIVAVGTTVVRALETVSTRDGTAAGAGWTDLVITAERSLRAVDALITGFHEPRASHLAMLEAIAGRPHLAMAYAAALRERYLWHEFGDVHLIMRHSLPAHEGRLMRR
jgi:S-adenosylmethionine:tRNA ribosyltransferase-isomerase